MDFYKIIISLLLFVIIILMGILIFIILNYFKKNKYKNRSNLDDQNPTEVDKISQSGFCFIHNDVNSVGICSICEEDICVSCVKQMDKVSLCPSHLKTYIQNRWVPITNQKTTPDTPEAGVYIYNFKKKLWKDKSIPTFVMNDYKINIDDDFIETYVQLYVTEDHAESLSQEISMGHSPTH